MKKKLFILAQYKSIIIVTQILIALFRLIKTKFKINKKLEASQLINQNFHNYNSNYTDYASNI